MMLGIDLGTTHSLAALWRDGKVELIANALGDVMTPSAVSVAEDGSVLVGLAARERLRTHPRDTATGFKRWMGTDRTVKLGAQRLRPEELSALVLRSLKDDAQRQVGERFTQAVVTVPAYFNDMQRQATRAAAQLAGFETVHLLNEPTAAGLAYGLEKRAELCSFLVFDLGGGTFDVSVLEYFEGVVEVRASAGDTHLGGEDFVEVIVDWLLEASDGVQPLSQRDKERIVQEQRLWGVAEMAKRALTDAAHTTVQWPWQGQLRTLHLTREAYAQRCEKLLARLRRPLERALSDARIDPGALDQIVLVGGASRMPMVQEAVGHLFARVPLCVAHPEEAIARGAAMQAALKMRDAALQEIVLTDVMPYSLGVIASEDVAGKRYLDRFSPIIERNTPVPVSRVKTYFTASDMQTEIRLPICQGESPKGSDNLQLGVVSVCVPPRPEGEISVQVRFTYDTSGLLEVQAHVPATGHTLQHIIQRDARLMTQAQIEAALLKLQALKIHPRDQQHNAWLLARARRLYEDQLGQQREHIGLALAQFEAVLDTQDEHDIRRHQQAFARFLDDMDDRQWRL